MKRAHALKLAQIAALCRETNSELSKVYTWAEVQNSIPTEEQAERMLQALLTKKKSLTPSHHGRTL